MISSTRSLTATPMQIGPMAEYGRALGLATVLTRLIEHIAGSAAGAGILAAHLHALASDDIDRQNVADLKADAAAVATREAKAIIAHILRPLIDAQEVQ